MVLALCLLLNRPVVGLLAVCWMWFLSTAVAGLPVRVFGGVLFAEGSFLLLAVAGLAVSVGMGSADGEGVCWALEIGPFWLASSPTSLNTALRAGTRALGGAAAMNFLALTTPLVDLIELMRRLRVPTVLIDVMKLMYRNIFVLLESLERMHTAQDTRLGYVNFRRGMSSAGVLASRLFIDAYQRGQRLQTALSSRGFTSDLKVLPIRYDSDPRIIVLGVLVAGSLTSARILL
jgi:cobalt/nickel transport system permease protein